MTQARSPHTHGTPAPLLALCLLLGLGACRGASGGPEPLPPTHQLSEIEALLGNLAEAPADLRMLPLTGREATAPLRVSLDEAVALHGDHIPPVSFRAEATWEGTWTVEADAEVFRITACRANVRPAVEGFERATCAADVAGRGDASFRSVLARLEGQTLRPGQILPIDLGEIAVGRGKARLRARVSLAGMMHDGARDLPVLRMELDGTAEVDAADDPVFTGHLDGQVQGLAALILAPGGQGLLRLDGVTVLRFEGDVRDHDGEQADHLRQVQSFRVAMSRVVE